MLLDLLINALLEIELLERRVTSKTLATSKTYTTLDLAGSIYMRVKFNVAGTIIYY